MRVPPTARHESKATIKTIAAKSAYGVNTPYPDTVPMVYFGR
jgi:hypothetical protein